MYYYKGFFENSFLGVATSNDLGKLFTKKNGTNIMISATEEDAQYILINNEWVRDNWLRPETIPGYHRTVKIYNIDKEEYDSILLSIKENNNAEIVFDEEPTIEEEINLKHEVESYYKSPTLEETINSISTSTQSYNTTAKINDSSFSDSTTYSSAKIESLIKNLEEKIDLLQHS